MQKRIYSSLELLSLLLFIFAFFSSISWLAILTGLFLIIDDILGMLNGQLNPLFPIAFAILLAFIIHPWYMGVFWSVAAFKLLNVPKDISVILRPEKHESIKEFEDKFKL